MEPLLLGIDIGTSACKVALFSPGGKVEATASAEYPVFYPQPGWAEQNPEDWWAGVCSALQKMFAASGISPSRIAGVGIDGQSWSAIPVDGEGRVLYNTPIWMDTRAQAICQTLGQQIGEEAIFQVCGNPLQPSYTLPKVLWYKKHQPEVYQQAKAILQSNGFIAYKLTGAFSQDLSQGYGYQCFNMRKGNWDEDLCREMGLRRDLLPEVVPCHHIVGGVTPEAAAQSGIPAGTPVVAGGLDAACGTLGAGVLQPGETQEQGGQAGGMSICLDQYSADPRLILSYHAAPGRWLLQGGTVGGGGVMRWFEEEFGAHERQLASQNGTNSFAEMDREADAIPAGAEGLIFLPYMAGERSPIWNPNAKGVYFGLDFAKTRAHMIRASLEGVGFSLQHNIEIARQAGAPVSRLRAMGGAANSRVWTQIKSDITGKPIDVPSSDTATTLGAAILAGVATGVYPSFEQAVATTVKVQRTHKPNKANHSVYKKSYQEYLEIYKSLQPLMKERNAE